MGTGIQRRLRGTPRVVCALAAGGLMVASPVALQAQRTAPVVSEATRPGWIGIVYDANDRGAPALQVVAGRTGLVVKDVVAGSPAVDAGLRAGDVLLALDGQPLAPTSAGMLQVQSGQSLRIQLLRDGRVVESRLVAAPRPPESVLAGLGRSARVDSLRVHIIQEMDSLLERDERLGRSHSIISIYHSDAQGVPMVVVREPQPAGAAPSPPSTPSPPGSPRQPPDPALPFRFQTTREPGPGGEEIRVSWGWASEGAGAESGGVPFGTFALSSDRVDALVAELQEVRGSLEALRAEERARQRELAAQPRTAAQAARTESALERVREAQRRLLDEAQRLEREMRTEGRRSLDRELPAPPAWTPMTFPTVTLRPLSPYVLGQRMVAGAEVTALNPDLAEYFGGEEGLLVLQVISGSPAAEAGFQAGDIVTRMGDRRVQTVDQARMALESSGQGPIPVTLVRRGRSVLTTLPR